MKLISEGQIIEVSEQQAAKLLRRGWAEHKEQAVDEVIRLKPPVKSKATAQRALEEAKTQNEDKGDE